MQLLLGDEAVALAAIDAGIRAAFSYPGTPSTEILEYVERRASAGDGLVATWSPNEKVAYEEALGVSFIGRRALVSMKHVGLNVAADPFMNSALTGARGGLVLAVADDPGMHSSQNEQDSRYYAQFAQIPLFEPANPQQAYDMTRSAFELSERLSLPVMVRLVTRLAHSRSTVRTRPRHEGPAKSRADDWREWTLLPVNARRRYRRLLEVQSDVRAHAEASGYNRLTRKGPHGILAAGVGFNYACEALGGSDDRTLLRIGAYPVPVDLVRELIQHCAEVLVVEEGYPFIERQIAGLLGLSGKAIAGKLTGALPPDGELTTESVRAALGRAPLPRRPPESDVPGRPPQLCQGCPHCDTYGMIMEVCREGPRPYLFSDIGCYTLAALPPYSAIDTCVEMGASIGMGLGAAKAGAHPVVCTIGDSTFIHSGMTPLIGAAHADANMTVFILDNATVAMTGGQEVFASGDDLVRIVRGLGADPDHVFHVAPLPKNRDDITALIRREIEHRGLSVIVASRPCIHTRRRGPQRPAMAAADAAS